MKNIIVVKDSINSIIRNSDYLFFTLSTLQFDTALLMEKPFGMLSRGILTGKNEAPYIGDFENIVDFLDEILDSVKWKKRQQNIIRKISFIIEYVLIQLSPEEIEQGINKFCLNINKLRGKGQTEGLLELNSWIIENKSNISNFNIK